jgi:uncharacterized membrane protein YkvA (DUF1232 family)
VIVPDLQPSVDATRLARLRARARRLKDDVRVIAVAMRDPRTPRLAKILGFCVVAYALSPIDLIPDPIPVLGYLDDLILVPLGITMVLKLIPPEVIQDSRAQVDELPPSRAGTVVAVLVVVVWVAGAIVVGRIGYAAFA